MLDIFMSEEPNEQLSNDLKAKLSELDAFRKSIVVNKAGYLTVFVRDGQIGKITFQRNALNSTEVLESYNSEEGIISKNIELPAKDYRVFAYLIATSITHIDEISYGTLRFQFKIEEGENGKFNSRYSLTFDEEIHYKVERNNNNRVQSRF